MIDTALFGRTGHASTRVIFGAAGLGEASQEYSDSLLEVLLASGINHIDTAADYGDAEERIGPWMKRYRSRFFLATKTGERSAVGARASIERSLERLQTDTIDLIQLHNLVEEDDWRTVHSPGGALEALVGAREEGLIRFIGVTGHGLRIPRMHLRSLREFRYDSVIFPYNYPLSLIPEYQCSVEELTERCIGENVAIQTIKAVARRRWQRAQREGEHRHSWYQPLEDEAAISRAARFTLAKPERFLICSSDYRTLPAILDAAATTAATPPTPDLEADATAFAMASLFGEEHGEVI